PPVAPVDAELAFEFEADPLEPVPQAPLDAESAAWVAASVAGSARSTTNATTGAIRFVVQLLPRLSFEDRCNGTRGTSPGSSFAGAPRYGVGYIREGRAGTRGPVPRSRFVLRKPPTTV